MAKALTNKKSIDFNIRETLLSILAAADPAYLKKVDLVQFEQGLIDEAHFLVPCDHDDMVRVEQYVHQHVGELYQMAQIANRLP
jgi:hypothetical protein